LLVVSMMLRSGFAFVFALLLACNKHPAPLRLVTAGGDGPTTMILLHGFGSTAERWLPFTNAISLSRGQGQAQGHFIFPEGPSETTPPAGPVGGRAWWPLELISYIRSPGSLPDLSQASPHGIETAAARVRTLLASLDAGVLHRHQRTILGGFSQGAMVSIETLLTKTPKIDGLVLLSGTLVNEAKWRPLYPAHKGLPVFIAHGRADDVLPFALAERMVQQLETAGLKVTWFPFEGGHEIPAEVIDALNRFLITIP
jgi:phospholipase/carboxylesterase